MNRYIVVPESCGDFAVQDTLTGKVVVRYADIDRATEVCETFNKHCKG